jgi:cytochrome b
MRGRAPVPTRTVLVWDLPTRLFHWLAAALVLAAYLTWRLDRMDWHARAGEALLALVLFRVAWGVWGTDTARFARFVAAPPAALRHLRHLLRREPDEQPGHNAAGGWMVLLLLALLLGESLSGVVVNNDVADAGPLTEAMPAWLADLVTDLHAWIWQALVAAVALHVAAIALYAAAKGQHLLPPMITGRKRLPARVCPPRLAPLWRAGLLLGASAAAAALIAGAL